MLFDPDNPIVRLCAEGMDMEALGKSEVATRLFRKAWVRASNNLEKMVAAHYFARQQKNVIEKLKWDELALDLAISIKDKKIQALYPSLHLNIGQCFEDLGNYPKAKEHYELASKYVPLLNDDGYGNFISRGISDAIRRIDSKL